MRALSLRGLGFVPAKEKLVGLAQETTFAQEVPYLQRRLPMQRERVQAAKDQVIALARQVRRRQLDGVVPRGGDDAAIEIRRRREPVHVAVGMRAKLRRCDESPTQEPQRKVRQPGATIRRRQQHDATELSRPSGRERAPHDDSPHAVADEMESLDTAVVVKLLCFGGEPRRMRLDRSPKTSIRPVHRAKALSLQGAP